MTWQQAWQSDWSVHDTPFRIEMGDLNLLVLRQTREWLLHYRWDKRNSQGGFHCNEDSSALIRDDEQPKARIVLDKLTSDLHLTPRLADRPVVVRPYAPITLAAGSKITLYVSTPIWLELKLSGAVTCELPVQQLSDTWMGALTGAGELCYGSHTHARLDPEQLLNLPYRVLTPVRIHNKSDEDRRLERLSLPTPYLSVFAGPNSLITESLSITMDADRAQGVVRIGRSPEGANNLSRARQKADKGILVSAWSNLFA